MTHFLFVRDEEEVLGVWVAKDEVEAWKMKLSLQLTYPGCATHVLAAPSSPARKMRKAEVNFGAIEAEMMVKETDN